VSEHTLPGEELLAGVAERDYARIAACFAETARFSVLTPKPVVREHVARGRRPSATSFWLRALEHFELLESAVVEIADRIRIRYRSAGGSQGWQLNEHTGYAEVEDGRIRSMILTCAGFRPTTAP
jgi:hypothetical protein